MLARSPSRLRSGEPSAVGQAYPAMTSLDIQLIPGRDDWSRLREASLAVDEGSYDALWVCDHLAGYSMSSAEIHEAFAWLGALAEATRRVELGALVVNAHNRTPATTLVAAATIARLSGRTFHLGLGAGTSPTSNFAREQYATSTPILTPMAARHRRVEAVLDLADQMWAHDRGPEFATFPAAEHRPRVIIGVNSLALARIAGSRADGVNVRWPSDGAIEQLAEARRAAGDGPFECTAYVMYEDGIVDPEHPRRRELDTAGVTRVIVTHIGVPEPAALAGP